jgi:hypothetical protein
MQAEAAESAASRVSLRNGDEGGDSDGREDVDSEESDMQSTVQHLSFSNARETQWGADFKLCKVGTFAIVHTEFDSDGGGVGVELYRVMEVVVREEEGKDEDNDQEAECFIGMQYVPSKPGINVTDPKCLFGQWHSTREKQTVKSWQVLHYFPKMTKKGLIMKKDVTSLQKTALDHDLTLFVAPEIPERISMYDFNELTKPVPGDEDEDEGDGISGDSDYEGDTGDEAQGN